MLRSLLSALLLLCIAEAATAATAWRTDPGSELGFRASQGGAEFAGAFTKFTASIVFDEKDLAGSRFDVRIATASAVTKDADRDGILKGEDLFHVAKYPEASYVATKFRKTAQGYIADGQLQLRGVTRPVAVTFTFTRTGAAATLAGTAQLKRLDFGVGQGDWKSTDSVANEVKVVFTLKLSPAASATRTSRNAAIVVGATPRG